MNKEDVIRMAKESGIFEYFEVFEGSPDFEYDAVNFERFANLVAAAAREEEREACAQVCEGLVYEMAIVSWRDMSKKEHGAHACRQAALAIRSRSDEASEGKV